MYVAATAETIERKMHEKPSIFVWCDTEPEECHKRLRNRDQPDDDRIKLSELKALDYYHIRMARELQQEGATVIVLERIARGQRIKQVRELASYIEGVVTGMEAEGKPQLLRIVKPSKVSTLNAKEIIIADINLSINCRTNWRRKQIPKRKMRRKRKR